MHREHGSLGGDVVKGAVAGAAGVWLMDQAGWALYQRENPDALRQEETARVEGKDVAHVAAGKLPGAVGVELSPEQPHPAGLAVHYALGIRPGMLYAPLRHHIALPGVGRGLLYGLALFLVNDELLNPVLGLASGPTLSLAGARPGAGRPSGPRSGHGARPRRPGPGRLTNAPGDHPRFLNRRTAQESPASAVAGSLRGRKCRTTEMAGRRFRPDNG